MSKMFNNCHLRLLIILTELILTGN